LERIGVRPNALALRTFMQLCFSDENFLHAQPAARAKLFDLRGDFRALDGCAAMRTKFRAGKHHAETRRAGREGEARTAVFTLGGIRGNGRAAGRAIHCCRSCHIYREVIREKWLLANGYRLHIAAEIVSPSGSGPPRSACTKPAAFIWRFCAVSARLLCASFAISPAIWRSAWNIPALAPRRPQAVSPFGARRTHLQIQRRFFCCRHNCDNYPGPRTRLQFKTEF